MQAAPVKECVAPKCHAPRERGAYFCAGCAAAPAGKRGGWISAHLRRTQFSGPVVTLGQIAELAGVIAADRARTEPAADEFQLDASCVAKRLWVGSQPPIDRDLPRFDVLVLCAREIQPKQLAFHGRVIRCPLEDNGGHGPEPTRRQLNLALATGRGVARELVAGKSVLVTCAMGLNRSALVAMLALGLCTRLSAAELVAIVRDRRDHTCLFNKHFVTILERYIGAGRRAPAAALPGH